MAITSRLLPVEKADAVSHAENYRRPGPAAEGWDEARTTNERRAARRPLAVRLTFRLCERVLLAGDVPRQKCGAGDEKQDAEQASRTDAGVAPVEAVGRAGDLDRAHAVVLRQRPPVGELTVIHVASRLEVRPGPQREVVGPHGQLHDRAGRAGPQREVVGPYRQLCDRAGRAGPQREVVGPDGGRDGRAVRRAGLVHPPPRGGGPDPRG